ncbi:protein of unknown function [Tenacibaculum aestuariivivum]
MLITVFSSFLIVFVTFYFFINLYLKTLIIFIYILPKLIFSYYLMSTSSINTHKKLLQIATINYYLVLLSVPVTLLFSNLC